ncbi:HAD family hydrolase [Agrobacterium salinitolerans]|uniref:phosphoglycolate phosphatase n=1 Tax=Agrobacterium salinitolerans TaxID=1183413 RepID=A0A9X3KRS0_9HYPH|nr:HAD family hydrolase [Agrobacterium salinitolerans]MCZ7854726.1 HAD family hydrolase [Agrobacterium salinitolerans]MCZ7939824.1 HAD family hydrolase [Agrobacterium salinitolerans]
MAANSATITFERHPVPRKVVDTLILDLDNTLFDWFAVWYASFEPIYREIIKQTDRAEAEIQADIRNLHRIRRTSEYTFLLEEIEALADLRQRGDIRAAFREAIELSRQGRDLNLKLYPSVLRSLWRIKGQGTKIVAYTESMAFYSAYRLKRFGLDGVIDIMFSPEDHDMPSGVSVDSMRRLPEEFYELQVTESRHTPPGELKPNPRVLLDIIKAVGATVDRCAYVGDSLFKDVAMARDVGVFDIHAKYGESQRRPEYDLLRQVSHWTEEDVQREKAIFEKGHDFEPSAVLTDSFAEIFIHCDFESFNIKPSTIVDDKTATQYALETWKKTVDVQQHFNDLEMRIRNFAITVVGALIASVGFTYQQGLQADVFGVRISAGVGLVLAAGFAWLAFFFMDRYWYHIFLRGAVKHASTIEKEFADRIPGIGLGTTISQMSGDVKILCWKTNSERRLTIFYAAGLAMLGVVLLTLLIAQPQRPSDYPRDARVLEESKRP